MKNINSNFYQVFLDLPSEVMIEVEPRCNFNCQFCFNKISFAKNGRNIKPFSAAYVKKIIDVIAKAKIKIVRFTGGEPLLRKDIFELMKYAKRKKLYVILNTNGSLITPETARRLKGLVDNILIPIEGYREIQEEKIIGRKKTPSSKIYAIKLLRKAGIPIIRVGTVAIKESIKRLEQMADFILRLPVNEWELYRPISSAGNFKPINNHDAEFLIRKLIKIRKRAKMPVFLANAFPFCAIRDLKKAASISRGAISDDGRSRLVIDPRNFVKPHYFLNKNIGNPLNIIKAWRHPFMKRMRNLKYLPKDCLNCHFKLKCRGGSRYEAKLATGSYQGLDPLARPRKSVADLYHSN